jgi:phosphatidylglycerophosphate synthase
MIPPATPPRQQLPLPPRQQLGLRATVLGAGALGLALVLGLASIARASLELSSLYRAKATLVFAAIVVTVIWFVNAHHPYSRFGPANAVTLTRAMLVALLAGLLGEPTSRAAAWAAAIVAGLLPMLDGVDGWLARRTRMLSAFGARFDMETDALHVLVMSGLAWQFGKAGVWVWIGGLLRYAFVAAGWLVPWMARPLRPTRRGRLITMVHMVALSVGLAPFVPVPLSMTAMALTLMALVWSFAVDIGRLWRGEGAT